jgi:hypothetical protein
MRVAVAFAIAPVAPELLYACFAPLYAGLPLFERIVRTAMTYVIFGGYLPTVLLGIPTFQVLRLKSVQPTALACAAVGAAVAAAPWVLLGLTSSSGFAISGGHVTYVHGMKTLWGWIEFATVVCQTIMAGALGGIVFWWVVTQAGVNARAQP